MIDPRPVPGWLQQPETGYDANIPHGQRGETRGVRAWAVTLQLSAFLAVIVLPIILVTGTRQAPGAVAVVALAYAAARRSYLHYLHVRVS